MRDHGITNGTSGSRLAGRSPIESARARHSLADVAVRTGIELWRASGSLTVRCPMPSHGHFDRTPSMRLHLDEGTCYCFGCGVRGDVVEWVEQLQGVGWRGAIRILDSGARLRNAWSASTLSTPPARPAARRPEGSAPEYPNLERTPAPSVFAALEAAWRHYADTRLHRLGAAYLRGRGIEIRLLEELVQRTEVGCTPTGADGLVAALRGEGFSVDELVDAGLACRWSDGRVQVFYRQRVLVPVRDGEGRACGFFGRNVGDARFPKYKNPPRTHAYDKSRNLYQPLPAPDRAGHVVVVEGVVDALAIAVAAISEGRGAEVCPVTQSGRELSAGQLRYVRDLCDTPPVIAFDGDAAGRDSTSRVAAAAERAGVRVRVVALPEGDDPATWLGRRHGVGLGALLPRASRAVKGAHISGHRALGSPEGCCPPAVVITP
jgi:DNA primase